MPKLTVYTLLLSVICLSAVEVRQQGNDEEKIQEDTRPKLSIILFTNRPGVYDVALRETSNITSYRKIMWCLRFWKSLSNLCLLRLLGGTDFQELRAHRCG
jgi:hypothetical protein